MIRDTGREGRNRAADADADADFDIDIAECVPEPSRRCTGPEDAERFEYPWDFDEAPVASRLEQLSWRGYEPPAPASLGDPELREELNRLVQHLADLHVFLSCTDHLDDRALYTLLVEDLLLEEVKVFRLDPHVQHPLDVLGGCSEEDINTWLRYYADEEDRARWAKDFPEDEMPEHVPPPFDRDRHLPPPLF